MINDWKSIVKRHIIASMKRAADRSFRIWSLLMILCGILMIALDVVLTIVRFQDPDISRFPAFLATLILFAAGVIAVFAGINSLSFLNNTSRGRRYRAVHSKIRSFKRLALAVILLCVLEVILSCVFGVILWQLILLVLFGICVPLIYLIQAKTIYS